MTINRRIKRADLVISPLALLIIAALVVVVLIVGWAS